MALAVIVAGGTIISVPMSAAAANPGDCVARSNAAPLCTVSYGYTGGEQSMNIPAGVTSLTVTAVGGRGGNAQADYFRGGSGASSTATVAVNGGTVLYVEVGGNGATGSGATAAGGFNGGGSTSFASQTGGGGGGASDVRTLPRANGGSLATRLVVGAGGAGAGYQADGGNAGQNGTENYAGTAGRAGTSNSGGAGGSGAAMSLPSAAAGTLGTGGDGPQHGGGGGGGLYGGGGGTVGAGGGGGSSLGSASVTSAGPSVTIQYAAPVASLVVNGSTSVVAGSSATYTAVATDASGAFSWDATASTVFTSSRTSVDTATGNSIRFGLAGSANIIGTTSGVSGQRTVTVTPGALSRLVVSPANSTVTAGNSVSFSATGFDSAGSNLGVISSGTNYTTTPSAGDTVTGASIRFSKVGTRTVTATNGTATGTATVTVTAGALASITIDPASATAVAGDSLPFTTTGRDAEGNSLGAVTSTTAFATSDTRGTVAANSVRFVTVGTTTVTATTGGFTATATITVTPATLASIVITPLTDPVIADTTLPFTATGFDRFGNTRGDVTATAVFTSSRSDLDSVSDNSIHFGMAGNRTITATIGGVSGTLAVTVEPGALASLVVTPADPTATAGDTLTFTVTGFDSAGSNLGIITDGTTYASVDSAASSTGDIVTDASIRFSKVGTRTVTATNGTATGTTTVTVTAGVLATITIDPASTTAVAGDTLAFATTGFDAEGNSLGDYSAATTLTSTDTAAEIDADSVRFLTAQTTTVTATTGGFTTDATITVTPAALASIVIKPVTGPVTAGTDQKFVVTGFDRFGNSLGDLAADAVFTISRATGGTATSFTTAGTYTVTATIDGIVATTTVTVVADAAAPAVISVTPSRSAVPQGGSITLTVTGEDRFGNALGDLTDRATFTSDWDVDEIDGSTVTFPHASTHTITATVSGVSGSTKITVVAPDPTRELAATGSSVSPLAGGLAAVLVLSGLSLLFVRRRRVE